MPTLITAHSGADGTPENSLSYLRRALASDADALEIDIRRGEGGGLYLGHDSAGTVSLRTALELTAAHKTMRVNCDLKEPGLEEEVCALAEDFGLGGRVILTGAADAERYGTSPALRRAAELWVNLEEVIPDLYISYRENPDFELTAAETVLAVCRRCHIRTVNLYHRLVTRRFLETLAAAGVGVSAWTVDAPMEIRWFLYRGAANITTRHLSEALALRRGAVSGTHHTGGF